MDTKTRKAVDAAIQKMWAIAEQAGLVVFADADESWDGTPQYVITLEGDWDDVS